MFLSIDVIKTDLLCGERTEMIVIEHRWFLNARYVSYGARYMFGFPIPKIVRCAPFYRYYRTRFVIWRSHRINCYWVLIIYECALRSANTRYEIGDVIETDLLYGDRTELIVLGH